MSVSVTFVRKRLTTGQIRELLGLMECQETTDKYTNTKLHIDGDYGILDVKIDADGNVIVLQG